MDLMHTADSERRSEGPEDPTLAMVVIPCLENLRLEAGG